MFCLRKTASFDLDVSHDTHLYVLKRRTWLRSVDAQLQTAGERLFTSVHRSRRHHSGGLLDKGHKAERLKVQLEVKMEKKLNPADPQSGSLIV